MLELASTVILAGYLIVSSFEWFRAAEWRYLVVYSKFGAFGALLLAENPVSFDGDLLATVKAFSLLGGLFIGLGFVGLVAERSNLHHGSEFLRQG